MPRAAILAHIFEQEAGLPKASVVNVTQIATIDRSSIAAKIGRLSSVRLRQVWDGVCLVVEPA
jgi:mRNA interferase MazF